MPSRNEQIGTHDFRPEGGTSGDWEPVIRRIGGNAETTEPVQAVVDFLQETGGGLTVDSKGKRIEVAGQLQIEATQEANDTDSWVIPDGAHAGVYRQAGGTTSGSCGLKIVNLTKRISKFVSEPATRNAR